MEYALRALVYLAKKPGETCTVRDIAESTQVPADYLSKIMTKLCREGVARSRPGRSGGYELTEEATEATLLDLVEAVEPLSRVEKCPMRKPCDPVNLCALHQTIRRATEEFANALHSMKLEDIVRDHEKKTHTNRDGRLMAAAPGRSI